MRRGISILLVLLVGAALFALACGSSSTTPSPTVPAVPTTRATSTASPTPSGAAGGATVETATSATLGSILVNSGGLTLYHRTDETAANIKCTGACATKWPPLLLPTGMTTPAGGDGVTGKLGSVTRAEGMQVTYDDMPLYTYVGDVKPGDTTGQGLAGIWFAAQPQVSASATPTAVASPSATPPSGY